MKKLMTVMAMLLCLSLVACGQSAQQPAEESVQEPAQESTQQPAEVPSQESEPVAPAATVQPLPDTTMDNLTDAILSVSLTDLIPNRSISCMIRSYI